MIPWNRHVPSWGSTGTTWGILLRSVQLTISIASFLLIIIRPDFYYYTSFRFLWIVMCFIITWNGLLLAWEAIFHCFFRQPLLQIEVLMIVMLDWVLSLLSLAAGSASASVVGQLLSRKELCRHNFCVYCQVSAGLALLNWFLILVSAMFNIRTLK
ncbi:CASP-like protein [Rhynchospora pubera]|uniref:CASP-like protein n=1 Tax=Rhynchospora pubera TaxID=906938 RepID=A0AAV8DUM7_9POAL|nr:CASP-like protein [Rhynchospora pubera]KAJ4804392.1 CASP-like protein [Rhynchospora pubera]